MSRTYIQYSIKSITSRPKARTHAFRMSSQRWVSCSGRVRRSWARQSASASGAPASKCSTYADGLPPPPMHFFMSICFVITAHSSPYYSQNLLTEYPTSLTDMARENLQVREVYFAHIFSYLVTITAYSSLHNNHNKMIYFCTCSIVRFFQTIILTKYCEMNNSNFLYYAIGNTILWNNNSENSPMWSLNLLL